MIHRTMLAALLLLEVLVVTTPLLGADAPFADALVAAGPHPSLGRAADVYAWLVGSWDVEVTDFPTGGPPRRNRGEWHFAWVLEGRALQDVWIVPPRSERALEPESVAGNRYGTSLRVYDPESGDWRLLWRNPVTGAEDHLVGRRVGDDVVHTGTDGDGHLLRWTFTDTSHLGFRWLGESSADGGATWTLEAEFVARRATQPASQQAATGVDWHAGWTWTDRPGLETLRVSGDGTGIVADGVVLVVLDGVATTVTYHLRYDTRWSFVAGTIRAEGEGEVRSLDVEQEAPGRWLVDGARRADLDGCGDLDLMVTPFTNTPPLLRLDPPAGATASLRVAWVRLPQLSVEPVAQDYTGVDVDGAQRRYRYHNLETGFEADVEVDARGLVTSYGPWQALGTGHSEP